MSAKVLHVIPTLDVLAGGTSAALAGMATAQAQAGLHVGTVATYPADQPETFAPAMTEQGVEVTMVGPTSGPLRRHPDLAATLRSRISSHDIVHIHGVWEEPQHLAFKLARELGRPAVLSPHGMLDAWSLAQSKLKKQLYTAWRLRKHLKHVDAFHFTTDEERTSVQRLGYPGKPLVVPLGLDLAEFDPLPNQGRFRARYPQLGDSPYALFLSRLHHKKGLELLLPAFAGAMKQHPHWKLVVAGPAESDEYLASLKALATSVGLQNDQDIFFAGMQRGAERVEAMVDGAFFVLPSYQENFGIVVAEAAAAGLPQVISEHVNLASFVESNDLGTITVQNVDKLQESLEQTLRREDLAAVGARARSATFDHFDWKNIGHQWIDIYAELVATRTR